MKHYLDLVPISAKVHRKQSRMSVFCIVLAVFLVTTIFGMADMFVRSQIIKTQAETGNWHIALCLVMTTMYSNKRQGFMAEISAVKQIVISSKK